MLSASLVRVILTDTCTRPGTVFHWFDLMRVNAVNTSCSVVTFHVLNTPPWAPVPLPHCSTKRLKWGLEFASVLKWEISFGPLGLKVQTKNSNQKWTGICAENGLRIGTWAKFGLSNGSHFPLFLKYPLKNPPLDTEVGQISSSAPYLTPNTCTTLPAQNY